MYGNFLDVLKLIWNCRPFYQQMDVSTSNQVLKKECTWEKYGWWSKSNDNEVLED